MDSAKKADAHARRYYAVVRKMDCTKHRLVCQIYTGDQILAERDFFLNALQQNIARVVVSADTLSPEGIQARLEELQKNSSKKRTTGRIMTPSPMKFSGCATRRDDPRLTANTGKKS